MRTYREDAQMDRTAFERHLKHVLECPAQECAKGSSCKSIVDPNWATLLGWGNPSAPILFVGLNPYYSDEGRSAHTVAVGTDPLIHARSLSLEGFAGVRHFAYHRRIMNAVRAGLTPEEAEDVPDVLDDFAFFSEVAFCPTERSSELPLDVIDRCVTQNLLPFVDDAGFRFIVAVGQQASFQAVRLFVSPSAAFPIGDGKFERYHGAHFEGKARFIVTSYHPNARGVWDRDAVARTLVRLSRERGVPLG